MVFSVSRRRRHRMLERRVRNALRPLELPSPLTTSELCRRLGDQRGRRMELLPWGFPVPGPYGMWIATAEADIIVFQSETTPAHQRLIIMHELGHIIADHTSARGEPNARSLNSELSDHLAASLLPELTSEIVLSALQRDSYETEEEYEAEIAGTIVLNWAGRIDHIAPPSARTALGKRVQDSLGNHMGWQ